MKSTAPIAIAAFAFLVVSLLFSSSSVLASLTVANEEASAAPAVYIVFVEVPLGEEPEAFHIRTLSTVLGSEAAAERAILVHYTHAASGERIRCGADAEAGRRIEEATGCHSSYTK